MDIQEFIYHIETLRNLEPEELVADLRLTAEEIVDAFPDQVEAFIKENF